MNFHIVFVYNYLLTLFFNFIFFLTTLIFHNTINKDSKKINDNLILPHHCLRYKYNIYFQLLLIKNPIYKKFHEYIFISCYAQLFVVKTHLYKQLVSLLSLFLFRFLHNKSGDFHMKEILQKVTVSSSNKNRCFSSSKHVRYKSSLLSPLCTS